MTVSRTDREPTAVAPRSQAEVVEGGGEGRGEKKGVEGENVRLRRTLGGEGGSGGGVGDEMERGETQTTAVTATARAGLPPLVPQGTDWKVAFSPGDGSSLVPGVSE